MRALLLLFVSTGAFASDYFSYETSLRAESQLRSLSTVSGSIPVASLEVLPLGSLDFHAGNVTRVGLSYAPRFLVQGPADSVSTQVLHRARFIFDVQTEGGAHFTFLEQAALGTMSFITAATSQSISNGAVGPSISTTPLDRIPRVSAVPFNESVTDVGGYFPTDRQTQFSYRLSYLYSGGSDLPAQATLPLQRRPQAVLEFGRQVSRTDALLTAALASYSTFEGSLLATREAAQDPFRGQLHPLTYQTIGLVEATQGWRHRLDTVSDFNLALGVSFVRQVTRLYGLPNYQYVPVALVGYRKRLALQSQRYETELSASFAPYIDRLIGIAYPRLDLTAQSGMSPARFWTLLGRLRTGVAVFPGPQQGTAVSALELAAQWQVRRELRLELGTRVTWQRDPIFSPGGYFEYVGFLSATLGTRGNL